MRLCGVIGDPVGHSLSPVLHRFWFERAGIAGHYGAFRVRAEELGAVFRAAPALGFSGFNVTVPHKEAAARLVDELDPAAARIGAVNTILVREDGTLRGLNTDGLGFSAHLEASAPDWREVSGVVTLLGAGGAARGIAFALLDRGIEALRICNRGEARARALADELRACAPGVTIEPVAWLHRAEALDGAALLINATSLGMKGQSALDLDLRALPLRAAVYDIVYVPLETPLLAAARARGHRAIDGLGMLLHQAAPGFSWWGGIEPEVDEASRQVVLATLAKSETVS